MGIREISASSRGRPDEFLAGLDSRLDRLESSNSRLNAFIRVYRQTSRPAPGADCPLFGLLFAVKDCFQVRGAPLSYGLVPPLTACCREDAALVSLLSKRGAFLAGSTNLDEACIGAMGENRNFGRVLNPLQIDRSALGSSSGSAAAVASGMVDFALGSDSGGSVRAPAAACGLCGFKGSPAVWPGAGMVAAFPGFDEPGFLTSSLDDLTYLFEFCPALNPVRSLPGTARVLIPCLEELSCLAPADLECFEILVQRLSRHMQVERLAVEAGFKRALDLRRAIGAVSFCEFARVWRLAAERFGDTGRALLELGRRMPDTLRSEAARELEELSAEVQMLLSRGDCLLTPALPEKPPRWEDVDNGRVETEAPVNFFLALANVCALPAVSFPLVCYGDGSPFSVQLLGGAGLDKALLARACEIRQVL